MARATATEEADLSSFQQRLLRAYESRLRKNTNSSVLVLIGGYAGSGKTELGQLLADMTGWSLLDKDLLTRPLVEHLLSALNNDPNDRQSETYQRDVRPVEYRCLLNAAFAQLDHGTACILTAPFLQEMPDPTWLRRIINRCGPRGIEVVTVWVDADVDSMYEYLVRRDAARDSWKLNHWDTYIRSLDPDLRPALPHFVVDNSRRTGDSLQQQAGHLAQIVSPL
jgi:predicted kinase